MLLGEEQEIEYDDINFNNAKVKRMLYKIFDSVKVQGKHFNQDCSDIEKELVRVANIFYHGRLGFGYDAYQKLYKFHPKFLNVLDPLTTIKKKRKLLMKRNVDNVVFFCTCQYYSTNNHGTYIA